jgi:hypothetical protein
VGSSNCLLERCATRILSLIYRPCTSQDNGTAELLLSPTATAPGPLKLLRFQVNAGALPGTAPYPAGLVTLEVPGDSNATIRAVAAAPSCVDDDANDVCVLVVSTPSPAAASPCLLQAHVERIADGAVIAPLTCLAAAAVRGLQDVSAAIAPSGSAPALKILAAITYSANGTVFGATACVTATSFTVNNLAACITGGDKPVSAIVSPDAALPSPLPFHVGAQVDVALSVGVDGNVSLFEAHGLGWCPSTEARNKQPWPKLCDQRPANPASGGKYLNWQFASRIADFAEMLVAGQGASPCSVSVLHGCFSMGEYPTATLVASLHAGVPPLLAILHAGITANDTDPDDAGKPVPFSGLVLDGWPVLSQM